MYIYAWILLAIVATPKINAKGRNIKQEEDLPLRNLLVGYENCRDRALQKVEKGKLKASKLKLSLNSCRELYPAVSTYINCKKTAVKKAGKDKALLKQATEDCMKYFDTLKFSQFNPVPFFITTKKKLYFAGVGLNSPIRFEIGRAHV